MKKILLLALTLAFLVSACGPEPEPTLSAADVQGTALAAAQTMIAETQAAIPTATPIPPTETASPPPPATDTPIIFPTQALQLAPTNPPIQPTAADICNDPKHLIPGVNGPKTRYLIVNDNKVPMTISLYLARTPHGECGYTSASLPKNGSVVLVLPLGCYSAWAWSTDPKKPINVSGYGLCANNTDKWTFKVTSTQIVLLPP